MFQQRNKNQHSGFAVMLAMIAIVATSFLLITSGMTTRSSIKVGGNYNRSIDLFNIAEVGLAKARPMIEGQDFDTLLTTYYGTPLISSTNFNTGSYEVYLKDNDDGDGNVMADADDIIVVTSTGTNKLGGKIEIETHLQVINQITTPPQPGGGPAGGLLCGTNSDVDASGSSLISGCDWDSPSEPPLYEDCTGSGCDGELAGDNNSNGVCDSGDDGGYGLVSENTLNYTGGAGNIEGPDGDTLDNQGTGTSCDDWRTLNDQLASLSGGAPGVTVLNGSKLKNEDVNDCDSPQVFIIDTGASVFNIEGNVSLCGMLIVASDTSINLTGTVTIEGIVMVMGDDTEMNFTSGTGTSNIFGQVIVNEISVDGDEEIGLGGNSSIKYSSEAIGYAQQALSQAGVGGGGAILTVSWKESY